MGAAAMKLRDAVVTYHIKDHATVRMCCESLKSVLGIDRIFIVGTEPVPDCEFVHEEKIGFVSKADIAGHVPPGREGWILQQLLKLAACYYIPELDDRFLVCDADIVFTRDPYRDVPDEFWPYATACTGPRHEAYGEHTERVLGIHPLGESFINHHMVFDRSTIDGLVAGIEEYRDCRDWIEQIIACLNPDEHAGFSEYDLYANAFLDVAFAQSYRVRLRMKHLSRVPTVADMLAAQARGYHIVSSQLYARSEE
jgi:hypothetical protein